MATPFKQKANFLIQTNKISWLHLVFTGSNRIIQLGLLLALSPPTLYLCSKKNACLFATSSWFHIGKFQLDSRHHSKGRVPHILERTWNLLPQETTDEAITSAILQVPKTTSP